MQNEGSKTCFISSDHIARLNNIYVYGAIEYYISVEYILYNYNGLNKYYIISLV